MFAALLHQPFLMSLIVHKTARDIFVHFCLNEKVTVHGSASNGCLVSVCSWPWLPNCALLFGSTTMTLSPAVLGSFLSGSVTAVLSSECAYIDAPFMCVKPKIILSVLGAV